MDNNKYELAIVNKLQKQASNTIELEFASIINTKAISPNDQHFQKYIDVKLEFFFNSIIKNKDLYDCLIRYDYSSNEGLYGFIKNTYPEFLKLKSILRPSGTILPEKLRNIVHLITYLGIQQKLLNYKNNISNSKLEDRPKKRLKSEYKTNSFNNKLKTIQLNVPSHLFERTLEPIFQTAKKFIDISFEEFSTHFKKNRIKLKPINWEGSGGDLKLFFNILTKTRIESTYYLSSQKINCLISEHFTLKGKKIDPTRLNVWAASSKFYGREEEYFEELITELKSIAKFS